MENEYTKEINNSRGILKGFLNVFFPAEVQLDLLFCNCNTGNWIEDSHLLTQQKDLSQWS